MQSCHESWQRVRLMNHFRSPIIEELGEIALMRDFLRILQRDLSRIKSTCSAMLLKKCFLNQEMSNQ